jgi:ketosteroid isomerase-like protein
VSHENVELVRSLAPRPDANLAQYFRDDLAWAAVSAALAESLAEDFKCTAIGYLDTDGETFEGVEGFRYMWLEWLRPWSSYRSEIEEWVDLGDDVLLLVHDFGCHAVDTPEVRVTSASIWTVRDGKIVKIAFFADRSRALKAVGLEE